jgi:hypothetical protein
VVNLQWLYIHFKTILLGFSRHSEVTLRLLL